MDVDAIYRVLISLRDDVDPNKTLTDEDIERINEKSTELGRLASE